MFVHRDEDESTLRNKLKCLIVTVRCCSSVKMLPPATSIVGQIFNPTWKCSFPLGIYLFKVQNGNARKICEICLKLIKIIWCLYVLVVSLTRFRVNNPHSRVWIHTPVWPNGWVLVYELSGCGFESSCNHLESFC